MAMINELADFEKESSSVHATETSLLNTLSFPDPSSPTKFTAGYAKTLLIIAPGSENGNEDVAGMALYFTNYSTWRGAPGVYLEDLFVRPAHRRKGYAKALLHALAKETKNIGGGRLEWACLKWNENALKFYGEVGAKRMDEWVGLRVDGDALVKLASEQPK